MNEPRRLKNGLINRKAEDADIQFVHALHVDIDARVGESQGDAIKRIIAQLEAYAIPPSEIDVTGGGCAAYWRLKTPLENPHPYPEGDPSSTEYKEALERRKSWAKEIGRVNVQLERDLDGDHCHDVSRIMRAPFTTNIPDTKKRAKGRQLARAYVHSFHPERLYDLSAFKQADATPPETLASNVGDGRANAAPPILKPLHTVTFEALSDLLTLGVPPETIELIEKSPATSANGKHGQPLGPGGIHMKVVSALLRAGLTPVQIKRAYRMGRIAADADQWPRGFDGEMDRLIERASELNYDPALATENGKQFVTLHGGKPRVVLMMDDDLYPGRKVPVYMTLPDFEAYRNNERHVYTVPTANGVKTVTVPKGTWWVNHPKRCQYAGIIYAPNFDTEVVDGKFNLWTGFSVAPRKAPALCRPYLRHLWKNVCRRNRSHFHYLIGWMANAVQHPERPGEVGIVFQGQKGTGKTFAVDEFGAIFGHHYLTVLNPDHLTGKFNSHLQNCSVLLADECLSACDRKHEQIAKGLVTGHTIFIEPKGVNAFQVKNFLHVFLCTNEKWAIPATEDERRWFVCNVSDAKRGDHAHFKAIKDKMDHGGRAALLYMLQHLQLDKLLVGGQPFEIRRAPKTDALIEQQALTRHGVDALIEEWAESGNLPFALSDKPNIIITSGEEKGDGFDHFIRTHPSPELRFLGPLKVKRLLAKEWGARRVHSRTNGTEYYGIALPPLTKVRAAFETKHGPQHWPEDVSEWGGSDVQIPF